MKTLMVFLGMLCAACAAVNVYFIATGTAGPLNYISTGVCVFAALNSLRVAAEIGR